MAYAVYSENYNIKKWKNKPLVPYSEDWFSAYNQIALNFTDQRDFVKYPIGVLNCLQNKFIKERKNLAKFAFLTKNLNVFQEPGNARQELIHQQEYGVSLLTDLINIASNYIKYQNLVGMDYDTFLAKREKIREKRKRQRQRRKERKNQSDW